MCGSANSSAYAKRLIISFLGLAFDPVYLSNRKEKKKRKKKRKNIGALFSSFVFFVGQKKYEKIASVVARGPPVFLRIHGPDGWIDIL